MFAFGQYVPSAVYANCSLDSSNVKLWLLKRGEVGKGCYSVTHELLKLSICRIIGVFWRRFWVRIVIDWVRMRVVVWPFSWFLGFMEVYTYCQITFRRHNPVWVSGGFGSVLSSPAGVLLAILPWCNVGNMNKKLRATIVNMKTELYIYVISKWLTFYFIAIA